MGLTSFRAVPRILNVLLEFGISLATTAKVPHYTTLILQTLKVGLFRLKNVAKITTRYAAIIDHSIKIGRNKIFLVLRVPIDILEVKKSSICLADCEVIGMKIRESWSGDQVAEYLNEVFELFGPPVQIIRDGGKDLVYALNKLLNVYNFNFVNTSDIGHYFANIIKRRFLKIASYNELLIFIGSLSKKMALTEIAHLMPPKLRTKGRFLGISRVVLWANNILRILEENRLGDNIMKKVIDILGPIKKYKWTIEKMNDEFTAINLVLEKLKNLGLTFETLEGAICSLESLGSRSNIKSDMVDYLVQTYEDSIFLKTCVITSTDIIESTFGKLKYLIIHGPMDIGRLALLLPCLCGKKISVEEIMRAMNEIQIIDIKKWEEKEVGKSLLSKRLNDFTSKQEKVPNDNLNTRGKIIGNCQQYAYS